MDFSQFLEQGSNILLEMFQNLLSATAVLIVQERTDRLTKTKLNSVALVRERTVPTERPPPVGEVSANFCG
jgi:hypothetical protein